MSETRAPLAPVPLSTPGRTPHLLIKLSVLVVYMTLLLLTKRPLGLLLYAVLSLILTMLVRLPMRRWLVPLLSTLVLIGAYVQPAGLFQMTLLSTGRLFCLLQFLLVFGAMTQTSELLQFFTFIAARLPVLYPPLYVLASTLAVLPSIRQDMRKSMDVAILRKGSRAVLLSMSAWSTLLADVLVRTLVRGQRLADSVTERGYRLAVGLTPLPTQRFRLLDVVLGLFLLLPGMVIYWVML